VGFRRAERYPACLGPPTLTVNPEGALHAPRLCWYDGLLAD